MFNTYLTNRQYYGINTRSALLSIDFNLNHNNETTPKF